MNKILLLIMIVFCLCGCTNEPKSAKELDPNTSFRFECEENGGIYTEYNGSHYENACTYITKDQVIEMLNNRV